MSKAARLSLLFLLFADLLGFGMLIPDVQLRAEALGAPGWLIGAVLSSMFIVQAIASPIWGRVGDKVGRKKVLLACTGLSVLSMFAYSQATSIWVILASRILAGFGGGNVAAAQALVSVKANPESRAVEMGKLGAAISAGLVAGPAIGGFLAEWGGALLVGLVAGSLSLCGLLVAAWFVPKDDRLARPEEYTNKKLAVSGTLKALFAIATVSWLALATLEGTFGRLLKHIYGQGQLAFGAIFAYESLLGVAVQAWMVGPVVKRFGERSVLIGSYLLQGAGLAAMPFAGTMTILVVASTIYSVGAALANPTLNAWVGDLTPEQNQGAVFGLLQSARSIGFMVGPAMGGVLFDWQIPAPYVLAGVACLLASIATALLTVRRQKLQPSS